MNWANLVTYSRIALIPVVVSVYYSDMVYANFLAALIFTIAAVSDWLDGYLARRLDLSSEYGAFIDPVADKLLIAVVLLLLVTVYPVIWIATSIIIAREILVSALREWMATRGNRDSVAVAFSGKLKTTVQMIAIIALLLAGSSLPDWILTLGLGLIYLAALLSIWSMVHYFRNAYEVLSPKEEDAS